MGNSLRCCLACVLPCGALDLIRIVHLNGNVEEITRPVTAGEVLKNYPNHVLSKPSSQGGGVVRKILILSNSTELKRGSFYFLIPSSSVPENKRNPQKKDPKKAKKIVTKVAINGQSDDVAAGEKCVSLNSSDVVVVSERKKGGHRRARRTVQASEWRPHLESIFEE